MAEQRRGNLRIDYDEDGDVLYISLGDPEALPRYDEGNGFIVGRKNGSIVAVTILHYEEDFCKTSGDYCLRAVGLPQEMIDYLALRPQPPV